MADLNLSIIVRAVDKATAPVRKITAVTGQLSERIERTGRSSRTLADRQRYLQGRLARTTNALETQTRRFRSWATSVGIAERAGRSFRKAGIAFGLASIGGYFFKRMFVDTATQMEDYRVMLATIEGSSERAEESMKWIKDFGKTTPFQIGDITESFIKLRNYGFDPTTGLMRELGDMSASMGKPMMQAVEAIADAVMGENERLKEFGIKARVEGDVFRYTFRGATVEAQMDDQAAILTALRQIMQEFDGSMEARSKTFRGMVSNLLDSWSIFQDAVMRSGPLQQLSEWLKNLMATLTRMDEDGSLQKLAELVGQRLEDAFVAAKDAFERAWPWVLRIGEAFSWAAEKLGGWVNLALTLTGLYIASPFISLTAALKGVAEWSGRALKGVSKLPDASAASASYMVGGKQYTRPTSALWQSASARAPASTGGFARLGRVFRPLTAVLGLLSLKFIAIAAIAAVVVLSIRKYWEPLKAFFGGVWAGFTEALKPVFVALAPLRALAAAVFGTIAGWLRPVIAWFRELLVPVKMSGEELGGIAAVGRTVGTVIGSALKFLIELPGQFFAAWSGAESIGSALVTAIGDGIMSAAEKMLGPLKWVLDKARDLLPFSDAKEGPLARLTASGGSILGTLGEGVRRAGPGGLRRPLAQALGTAAVVATLTLPTAATGAVPAAESALPAGAAAGTIQNIDNSTLQIQIYQQPGEDAQALADRMLREIEARRQVRDRGALHDEL